MNMILKSLLLRALRVVFIPFLLEVVDKGSSFLNRKLKEFADHVEA